MRFAVAITTTRSANRIEAEASNAEVGKGETHAPVHEFSFVFFCGHKTRISPDKSPTRFEMSRTWSRHGLGGLKSRGNARALPLGPLIHTLEASLPSKPPANGPSRAQRFAP